MHIAHTTVNIYFIKKTSLRFWWTIFIGNKVEFYRKIMIWKEHLTMISRDIASYELDLKLLPGISNQYNRKHNGISNSNTLTINVSTHFYGVSFQLLNCKDLHSKYWCKHKINLKECNGKMRFQRKDFRSSTLFVILLT